MPDPEPKDTVKKEDKKVDAEGGSVSNKQVKAENNSASAAPLPPDPEREAYLKLRKTLGELVAKKNSIDRYLEEIEENLYTEEGLYLQETNAGNIAKGFDQYTKTTQHRRKSVLTDDDRIFSQSSTSFEAE